MPNSGTVTAGSVALASQYNNLRDDVLNVSTGHTHTGAADAGAQIEGTALKSTGATAGHVLTAGTGGTATTWAALPAGGGQLTFGGMTSAAYGTTSTADGTVYQYTSFSSASYGFHAALSHGGTVVSFVNRGTAVASTPDLRFTTIELTNTTSVANTTISTGVGGTIQATVAGDGFKGGTAVVVVASGSLSSTYTGKVSKWNKNGTNMWITTFNTFATNGLDMDSYAGYSNAMVRYASAPDIYYWGEAVYPYSTVTSIAAGTGRHSKVYIVNNTSGSVYSAAFSSAATTTSYNGVKTLWFVPDNAGTPTAGTIHAIGYQDGTPQYVKYSVGSASITAISTATGAFVNSGAGVIEPFGRFSAISSPPFYHTDGKVYMFTSNGSRILERTCGTVLFAGPSGANAFYNAGYAAPEIQNDFTYGYTFGPARYNFSYSMNESTMWKFGSLDNALVGTRPYMTWFSAQYPSATGPSYAGIFGGAGSVTTAVWWQYSGNRAVSFKHTNNVDLAKVAIPGTGNRMIIEMANDGAYAMALEANGTSVAQFNIHDSYYYSRDMNSTFVLTGGTAYMWVAKNSIPSFGTAGFLASGFNGAGSAIRYFAQITLS
jgi:hypothetical protein